MYSINFKMEVSEEMVAKWSALKGYGANPMMPPPPGGQANMQETEMQFFERTVKQELLNICINPLQNAIYQQANSTAQQEIEALRAASEAAMQLTVEKN